MAFVGQKASQKKRLYCAGFHHKKKLNLFKTMIMFSEYFSFYLRLTAVYLPLGTFWSLFTLTP